MPDYRKMFDEKEHFYAYDLDGRDRTLEIAGVTAGELTGDKNRKTKKPMVSFVGEKKKLAINKTNGKTIAALYGTDTERWVGEFITIFPTTTDFGGQTVECIRVKPHRPDPQRSGGRAQASDRRSNGGSRQSKPDRAAADQTATASNGKNSGSSYGTYDPAADHRDRVQSAEREAAKRDGQSACQYLVARYEACDSDEELATIKGLRGQAWTDMSAQDRQAVADAALAAKARIDAAAKTAQPADGGGPSNAQPDDDDEADEIARDEAARAARGE